jgi:fatty acid desaturase
LSLRKTAQIWGKDFILYPLLAGPLFPVVLAANVSASVIRNIWSFSIIFCGHFPDGVHSFTEASCENESRGRWYYRQLLGSANLTGGKLFHVMSGNLSHQIEHHLFPDVPAHRYAEMSVEVRQICEKYGLPYNTGPLYSQYATVWVKIFKLALPPRNPTAPQAA